ncbi:hypothetical protein N7490_001528 [Penicillium lividum]|nr:hypothetical protein N7490_001528 [Penicillium lividum]
MGNVTSVTGVKSPNFYEQGNGINEIWVDGVEVISRLPFGDSDLGQAGWLPGDWPKIPWHQFIIPLKRDLQSNIDSLNFTMSQNQTCKCQCEEKFPENGYFGLYKGWDTESVMWFTVFSLGLGYSTLIYLASLVQSDRFSLQLHKSKPDVPGMAEHVLRTPIGIRKWQDLNPWFWKYLLRIFAILIFGIVCVILALPGTIALKDLTGPEVYYIMCKWIGINLTIHCAINIFFNVFLLFLDMRIQKNDELPLDFIDTEDMKEDS